MSLVALITLHRGAPRGKTFFFFFFRVTPVCTSVETQKKNFTVLTLELDPNIYFWCHCGLFLANLCYL